MLVAGVTHPSQLLKLEVVDFFMFVMRISIITFFSQSYIHFLKAYNYRNFRLFVKGPLFLETPL